VSQIGFDSPFHQAELENYRKEWIAFMYRRRDVSLCNFVRWILKSRPDNIPDAIYFLATVLILLPLTSVEAERMFSQLKIIKTKLRTKMSQAFLNSLVRIRYNGPPSPEFFAEYSSDVINHWRNMKRSDRVIFK
jgi:hypothetical protein